MISEAPPASFYQEVAQKGLWSSKMEAAWVPDDLETPYQPRTTYFGTYIHMYSLVSLGYMAVLVRVCQTQCDV